MDIKEYNFCKKCPNGCCKELVKDTLNQLFKEICEDKRQDIEMFGDNTVITLAYLKTLFEV